MATLTTTYLDLIDLYRRTENNKFATIIEVLTQEHEVVRHAPVMECNKATRHLHTIRTNLPTVTWGKLYQGIPQSKSGTQQVEDVTGFVEASSRVDVRLLDLAGDKANALRMSESAPFTEAMMQEIATGIFYHDQASTEEKFTGLAARYNTLSGTDAANQVVDAGGSSTDNTSIWFVNWGPNTTGLLYPQGTKGGMTHEDMGKQRVLDSSGNPYYVMEDIWRWHIGMYVKDWRYNARVANLDVSNMVADPTNVDGSNNSVYDFMIQAYYKLQSRRPTTGKNGGKLCIYMNRTVLQALDELGTNAGANDNYIRLGRTEIQGQEVPTYRNIPIYETDAILNTEAQVT